MSKKSERPPVLNTCTLWVCQPVCLYPDCLCVCIHQSSQLLILHLTVCFSISLSSHLSVHLYLFPFIYLSVSRSVHLYFWPFVCLSIFFCPFVRLLICLSVFLPVRPFVCLFMHHYVSISDCPFVCLSICHSIHFHACPFVYLYFVFLFIIPCIRLSVSTSVYLSFWLFACKKHLPL